jgi:hypothetical protein
LNIHHYNHKKKEGSSSDKPSFFFANTAGLLTQSESLNDSTVTLDITILQVVEESATLTYQFGQCSCSAIIFTVLFQVLRQVGNTV